MKVSRILSLVNSENKDGLLLTKNLKKIIYDEHMNFKWKYFYFRFIYVSQKIVPCPFITLNKVLFSEVRLIVNWDLFLLVLEL